MRKLVILLLILVAVLPCYSQINKTSRLTKEYEKIKLSKIVSKIKVFNNTLSEEEYFAYAYAIKDNSKKFDIPKNLIISIIARETLFRNELVSPVGCIGPMQVNPSAWKEFDRRKLKRIDYGIYAGCRVLRTYLDIHKSESRALLAYAGSTEAHWYVKDIQQYKRKVGHV